MVGREMKGHQTETRILVDQGPRSGNPVPAYIGESKKSRRYMALIQLPSNDCL